jgi:hypothetical protein
MSALSLLARPLALPSEEPYVFRREGEYWTVAYDGAVVRLRDSTGLRHLAQLLWHPHREFHVLELMRALALAGRSRGGRPPATAVADVDRVAATAYRQRVQELQEDLAEAESWQDLGQRQRLREEIDALLGELGQGTGRRYLRTDAERARTAVTKALKAALSRIRAGHPSLASHLDAALKRGYVCIYRPDPRAPIGWTW